MSPAVPAWLRRQSPQARDAWFAAAVGVPVVLTAFGSAAEHDQALAGVLLGVASVVALAFRRRWPFAVLVVCVLVVVAMPAGSLVPLTAAIALYTIGATRTWEATAAAVAFIAAVGLVYIAAGGPDFSYSDLSATILPCALVAGLGLYVGSRRDRIAALHDRAERLQRERELLAQRAVADERVRIAQELHDVVGHNVSLIVVQAQALGATADDERVKEVTNGIADLGRAAMAEMHRTLKLLRANQEEGALLAPQPGLADLDGLLERSRAAGLGVDLAVEGEPRRLSQGIDLSAFRIIQEALTNVVKHAGRAHATVMLGYRADALELTITDRGGGARSQPNGAGGGHGLVGMRERVALYGGVLTAGPRGDDGFEVHARLPYDEARGA
jgi:signal transduction histidine kinase